MKKFILLVFLFGCFEQYACSQRHEKKMRREIDSLRGLLPSLRDSARVDCLVMISDRFNDIPVLSLQQQIDSSWPIALQAYNEAKRIGYKRGMGYALLRMGECEDSKDDMNFEPEKKNDPQIIADYKSCIRYFREAIAIGEKINDHVIQGYSYNILAWLEEKRENMKLHNEYMGRAIYHYENAGDEMRRGNYREKGFVDKPGCKGNEIWLADAYSNLGRANIGEPDSALIRPSQKTALGYYEKAGDKKELADAWYWYRRLFVRERNNDSIVVIDKMLVQLYGEAGELDAVLAASNSLCAWYYNIGNFEEGINYARKGIQLTEQLAKEIPADSVFSRFRARGMAFYWMGQLYKLAGDYESALRITSKGKRFFRSDSAALDPIYASLGELYRLQKNYDSARYYLEPFLYIKDRNTARQGISQLGLLYVDLGEYDSAIAILQKNAASIQGRLAATDWITISLIDFRKKDFPNALLHARMGLAMFKYNQRRVRLIDSYMLLADIFHSLNQDDSAYYYQKQFSSLRDSLYNRQFYWRLNSFQKEADEEKKTSQINLLNKQNELKNQQLKQQRLLKTLLGAGILIILLLSGFIYRNLSLKRKNEQMDLRRQAIDLEMQALRAQMNPHFIFNCLSSINRFILKNEVDAASEYLTRFSRLIRMVLINSQKSQITLEEELEMLRLYLDMERMRFKKSFDYKISFLNEIDAGAVFMPPLLIQPFCENAIWHGLMHNERQGRLDISMRMDNQGLCCTISDNGIGREKAAEIQSRSAEQRKSYGLKITKDRLALLNRDSLNGNSYEIQDLVDDNGNAVGTRVILMIGNKLPEKELI